MNQGKATRQGIGTSTFRPSHPRLAPLSAAAESSPALAINCATVRVQAERRLIRRVIDCCHRLILEACKYSSVPPAFLGALTANESGGDPRVTRFEPTVYRHLKAVADGQSVAFGSIEVEELNAEIEEILHPKAAEFHAHYLTGAFGANHGPAIAALEDDALRELATSWGLTQIMGYHMVGRRGTWRDLREPQFHYRVALELLAEFAEHYQLDLTLEYAEMFCCWNTGQPYGKTYDPGYVEKGLRRMRLYSELASLASRTGSESLRH